MKPEQLDQLYTLLARAIDRAGDDRPLLLATLSLDLLAHATDFSVAQEAILRAERLMRR